MWRAAAANGALRERPPPRARSCSANAAHAACQTHQALRAPHAPELYRWSCKMCRRRCPDTARTLRRPARSPKGEPWCPSSWRPRGRLPQERLSCTKRGPLTSRHAALARGVRRWQLGALVNNSAHLARLDARHRSQPTESCMCVLKSGLATGGTLTLAQRGAGAPRATEHAWGF